MRSLQVPDNQFYFFQFPKPFPKFLPTPVASAPGAAESMDVDDAAPGPPAAKKGVSFAAEVKTEKDLKPSVSAPKAKAEIRRPEGQIGELITTKKGKVKMRLGNGILYDVSTRLRRRPSILNPIDLSS